MPRLEGGRVEVGVDLETAWPDTAEALAEGFLDVPVAAFFLGCSWPDKVGGFLFFTTLTPSEEATISTILVTAEERTLSVRDREQLKHK